MNKPKYDSVNLHKMIALVAALQYQLRKCDDIKKELAKLSLKVKRIKNK